MNKRYRKCLNRIVFIYTVIISKCVYFINCNQFLIIMQRISFDTEYTVKLDLDVDADYNKSLLEQLLFGK